MKGSTISARIATLERPRHLVFAIETIDATTLGANEILCESIVTAISPGTELAAYAGLPPLRPGPAYPRVVGYCNVARVLQAGSAVSGIRIGDRVVTYSSHRSHFRIPASEVLAVPPDELSSDDAACAYLFHLGYNAVLRADVRPGATVVVIGLGVLGLGTVAVASLAGARVFGISEHRSSRDRCAMMGGSGAFSRGELPALQAAVGAERAAVVVSTSNRWEDWRLALECAGTQGTIAVLGFPGRGEPAPTFNPFEPVHFYTRQLRIVAVGQSPEQPDPHGFLPFNVRDNMRRILRWMQDGRLRASWLVSGAFPADEIGAAYERLISREGAPLTFLLRWAGTP